MIEGVWYKKISTLTKDERSKLKDCGFRLRSNDKYVVIATQHQWEQLNKK
jgi:hypothetical protein